MCPTPKDKCCGSLITATNGMRGSVMCHNTSEEAHKCYSMYLISAGYKQIGQREFLTPDNTILVLNKKSKFGQPVRAGKRGEKGGGGSSSRCVIKQRGKTGGTTGCVVVI